jgi:hypothetical protein
VGFSIHDPAILQAIERGLIRREDIEPLAGARMRELYERQAKERQREHGGTAPGKSKSLVVPSPQVIEKGATRETIGKIVGVGGRAIDAAMLPRWSIGLDIPGLKIVSEMNTRQHWAPRARRFKQQAAAVRQALSAANFITPPPFDHCNITLTRIGRRLLDSDNLASGFKAIRDALAEWLGVDDGSDRLRWEYQQERGQAGIRITITGNTP